MSEHPIIFSGEMVRAILAGKKTQTRRVIKPQPLSWATRFVPAPFEGYGVAGDWIQMTSDGYSQRGMRKCPYGQIGDRLWVRETWKPGAWNDDGEVAVDYMASPELTHTPWIDYPGENFTDFHKKLTDEILSTGLKADEDGYFHWEAGKSPLKWRPSIFMPRWASRITLEITGVRVERVQKISSLDANAEGITFTKYWTPKEVDGHKLEEKWWDDHFFWEHYPQIAYSKLWNSINAKRGYSWESNPWVWVIEFRKVEK